MSYLSKLGGGVAVIAASLLTANQANASHAGSITQWVNGFGTGDGAWSTPSNWSNGEVPSSSTNPIFAFINVNGSGPANVSTAGQSVLETYVGQGSGDGALNILSGGDLNNTAQLYIAHDSGRNGTVTQSGGTLTVGGNLYYGHTGGIATGTMTGGIVNVAQAMRLSDFGNDSTATSSFSITGGTLNTGGLLAIGVRTGGSGTGTGSFSIGGNAVVNIGTNVAMRPGANSFSVDGSLADINMNRPPGSGITGFEVNQNSNVYFTFDSAGISPVKIDALMRWSNSVNTLNVDASAFTGTGTFNLFTFDGYFQNGITSFGTENVITAPGYAGTVNYNANSITVDIAPIPEPGALALLGLSGLVLARRRQTR